MNKSEEAVKKIDLLCDSVSNCDANDLQKVKILNEIREVALLMMEAHLVIARCKTLLIENGIFSEK
jgi:hypothetical protein